MTTNHNVQTVSDLSITPAPGDLLTVRASTLQALLRVWLDQRIREDRVSLRVQDDGTVLHRTGWATIQADIRRRYDPETKGYSKEWVVEVRAIPTPGTTEDDCRYVADTVCRDLAISFLGWTIADEDRLDVRVRWLDEDKDALCLEDPPMFAEATATIVIE